MKVNLRLNRLARGRAWQPPAPGKQTFNSPRVHFSLLLSQTLQVVHSFFDEGKKNDVSQRRKRENSPAWCRQPISVKEDSNQTESLRLTSVSEVPVFQPALLPSA